MEAVRSRAGYRVASERGATSAPSLTFSYAICLISVWTARARNLSIYSDLVRRVYLYQEVGLAFIHDHWVLGIKKKEKKVMFRVREVYSHVF